MLRVFITIIAYIMSFLSHSYELAESADRENLCEPQVQVEQVVVSDTLSKNEVLLRTDLN